MGPFSTDTIGQLTNAVDFPGLEYEAQVSAYIPEKDSATQAADTTAPPTPPSSRPRRRSILKQTSGVSGSPNYRRHSTSDLRDGGCGLSAEAPPRRQVSFVSVHVQEHDLTIGDHPDVSYGPPTSLDWTVKRRHSICLEDYEADRQQTRRTTQQLIINCNERNRRLKDAGHTRKDIEKATNTANRAKARRETTKAYANTPVGKVEEVLHSATRKVKRAIGITPKKKAMMGLENNQVSQHVVADGYSTKEKDWKQESSQPAPHIVVNPGLKRITSASA